MKPAIEYAALTLLVGALVYIGAQWLGNALADSFANSAARIERAGK